MNIQTVADNLRNTIAGKEHLLDQYSRALDGDKMLYEQKIAVGAASEFVKINIAELKRILQDVEQCRPEWNVHTCPYTETCHRID